ncbi:MAG: hypothetical protein JXK95_02400 [Bacteroidales bacterium]|nr:hypothetical protein [Bacteroidales bacterium]
MKATAIILVFTFCLLAVHTNTTADEKGFVRLRVVSIDWSDRSWDYAIIDTIIIQIAQGEEFGGKNDPKYFKLMRIVDSQTIEIQFSENIVVAGEPVSSPSRQNPILISEKNNCFRTRHIDAGTDYCIDILEVVQY